MSFSELIGRLEAMRAGDLPTHGGRTLAYVYDSGVAEADDLGRQALAMYASANGLDPTAFPSLLQMERDLVGRAAALFHGEHAAGAVTSGGTESILLAVLTAREAHPEITRPVLVAPTSVHAAFHKAAAYFQVEFVGVDVAPVTKRADVEAMNAAVSELAERVVLVAASAPSYAHGVIDPIERLATHAQSLGKRFHVDACIGGWVLPWAERLGHELPPWDFRVPGVTSISADLHKYAFTPKGVSLLMHRTPELRRPQYFASADWPGYTMLNATMQSTKSGGPLAAAWAVVEFLGEAGYERLTAAALEGTRRITEGIGALDHLSVVGKPDMSILAFETDDALDVFTVADLMLDHGWFVQPQMSFRGQRPSIHLTVSPPTAAQVDEFLDALRASVDAAVAAGPIVVDAELAAAAQSIDPSTFDDATFDGLLALAGLAGDGGGVAIPERMAPVNALLDVAPPALREALLIGFLDRLTRTVG